MIEDVVRFTSDSPYGDYAFGEMGVLKGFVSGGDGTPCAVVRKAKTLTYVLAPLTSIQCMKV